MLSPEQIEFRKEGIGGSEAAACIGLHPYKSAMELYAQKAGFTDDKIDSVRLRCGSFLEDFVLFEFCKATDLQVDVGPSCDMLRHPDHDFALANLDGRIDAETLLEIKTVGHEAWWKSWENGRSVPLYIQIQCQHYMWVTGAKLTKLAALVDMAKVHIFDIERDDAFIDDKLAPAVIALWENVQTKKPPAFDGSDSCAKALGILYPPRDAVDSIELYEHSLTAERYAMRAKKLNELKAEQKLAKNQLTAALGTYAIGLLDDDQILKRAKNGALTIKDAPKDD